VPANVSRDEFDHLEGRVSVVDREVEGEKLVTRHILEQMRHNSDDLATIKTRLDEVEGKVDSLDRKVGDLVKDLPKLIGEVMRQVLQERNGRD